MTNRSGTTANLLESLGISFNATCLLRLDWRAHEDLALGVSGAPEINHPPIDFQIDFVEMPGRMRLRVGLVAFTATNKT